MVQDEESVRVTNDRIGTRSHVATEGEGKAGNPHRIDLAATSPRATEARRGIAKRIEGRIPGLGIIEVRRVRNEPLEPSEMHGNRNSRQSSFLGSHDHLMRRLSRRISSRSDAHSRNNENEREE